MKKVGVSENVRILVVCPDHLRGSGGPLDFKYLHIQVDFSFLNSSLSKKRKNPSQMEVAPQGTQKCMGWIGSYLVSWASRAPCSAKNNPNRCLFLGIEEKKKVEERRHGWVLRGPSRYWGKLLPLERGDVENRGCPHLHLFELPGSGNFLSVGINTRFNLRGWAYIWLAD